MYQLNLYILLFLVLLLIYELISYFIEGIQLKRLSLQINREREELKIKKERLEEEARKIRQEIFKNLITNGFKVAGISYYKDNVISLLDKLEPDESEYVYDVREDRVDLVPEPSNPYDPNAIAVYMDDVKIGHVPKDLTQFVIVMIECGYSFIGMITNGDMYDDDNEIIDRNFSCNVRYYYDD